MSMQQSDPIHWDRHRASFNLTLILSLVVFGIGILSANPPVVLVGMSVAAFSWLTTPAQYMIFMDRIMIGYGKPRVRYVYFQQIRPAHRPSEEVELIRLPMGSRVRVSLRHGRPLFLQPKDPEEFQRKFQEAVDEYMREYGIERPVEES